MDNNIHANRRQRVRKRYKQQGLDGFHDHEVLEILLYYCYPRQDTNEIAHKMLREFKTLQNLFDANVETLMARLGCTENIALLLNLMPAIAKRYLQSKWGDKVTLTNPETAGEYAINIFAGDHIESFYVLCMDTQLRLNHTALIAKGTIDEVPVFTRELVRKVATAPLKILLDIKNQNICFSGQCEITCDTNWTAEALTNIIKNASEHSPENSTITITAGENPICKFISISDQGAGIPAAKLRSIFRRFGDTAASSGGTGIGLPLAKAIMRGQQGDVDVDGGGKGKGATFTLKFL